MLSKHFLKTHLLINTVLSGVAGGVVGAVRPGRHTFRGGICGKLKSATYSDNHPFSFEGGKPRSDDAFVRKLHKKHITALPDNMC